MKLEHFGMAEPGDCRVVFSAAAEELEAAVQAEKAAPDAPQDEDDLLTAAVNRAILEGFSPLFAQLMKENDLQPVTDPDFELLAVNRAEGFRAGAQFFCLPPLELGEYTGFTQPIQPRPIRELTIELEINRRHGDEDRAADAEGKRALRAKVTQDIYRRTSRTTLPRSIFWTLTAADTSRRKRTFCINWSPKRRRPFSGYPALA